MELRPLSLDEVRQKWEWIEDKLWVVVRRCEAEYIPADVYREVSEGRSFLYQAEDAGHAVGVAVLCEYTDRLSLKKTLCIELLWLETGRVDLADLRDHFDELARGIGAERVECFSPREGWTRVLQRIGYQEGSRSYMREVPYG